MKLICAIFVALAELIISKKYTCEYYFTLWFIIVWPEGPLCGQKGLFWSWHGGGGLWCLQCLDHKVLKFVKINRYCQHSDITYICWDLNIYNICYYMSLEVHHLIHITEDHMSYKCSLKPYHFHFVFKKKKVPQQLYSSNLFIYSINKKI